VRPSLHLVLRTERKRKSLLCKGWGEIRSVGNPRLHLRPAGSEGGWSSPGQSWKGISENPEQELKGRMEQQMDELMFSAT
jgi:hypothetical protein